MLPATTSARVLILALIISHSIHVAPLQSQNPESVTREYDLSEFNRLVLSEISDGKVAMLCDSYHGHGYFMNQVTGFLNHWIDELSRTQSDTIPQKLVLFLECTEEMAGEINRFIDTGDVSLFLKYYIEWDSHAMSNMYSAEYFIFLHKLKHIQEQIQTINSGHAQKVDLKICGAEAKSPFNIFQVEEMNPGEFKKKRLTYFAYVRDRLSAGNIERRLAENPGYKGIIFYGHAHLLRGKHNKNWQKDVIKEDMLGYYMVHYLDSIFTRDAVCTFVNNPVYNAEYEKLTELKTMADQPDYVVTVAVLPNHPMKSVFFRSKTYLNALNTLIEEYRDKQTKAEQRIYGKLVVTFVNAIMHTYLGENISNTDDRARTTEILDHADRLVSEYDVVESLKRCNEGLTVNILPGNWYPQQVITMLSNLPIFRIDLLATPSFNNGRLPEDIVHKIDTHKEDIATYLAVHNLFVSDQQESNTIVNYLNEKHGVELNSKLEWYDHWLGKILE